MDPMDGYMYKKRTPLPFFFVAHIRIFKIGFRGLCSLLFFILISSNKGPHIYVCSFFRNLALKMCFVSFSKNKKKIVGKNFINNDLRKFITIRNNK